MKSKWFIALAISCAFLVQDSQQYMNAEVSEYFDYTNQFLLGFRAQSFVPDIFNCFNNLESAVSGFNSSLQFSEHYPYHLWYEYTFNWTAYISGDFSNAYQYCCLSSLEYYSLTKTRQAQYATFTDYILSFLQNMLGNVVSFQRIYDKMITALQSENYREFAYQVGRLFNLLYDFQPVDFELMSQPYPAYELPVIEEDVQPADSYSIYKGTDLYQNPFVQGYFSYSENLNYFEVSYYLLYGFVNGTIGFSSDNSTKCLDLMKDYYWNTTIEIPWQVKGQYWTELSLQTSYYFRNVNSIVQTCLWATSATVDSLFDYGFSLSDWLRIMYNIIYNFGEIYDRTEEFIQIYSLNMMDVLGAPEWIYVGTLFGKVFYEVFMPGEYPDPEIVYPEIDDTTL